MPEINPIALADALREYGWEPVPYPDGTGKRYVSVRLNNPLEICHVMWDLGQHFQAEDYRPEIRPSIENEYQLGQSWVLAMYWPMQSWDFVGHP